MISSIFRITAVLAVVGLSAYYFMNMDSFVSLDDSLREALEKERNSSLQLDIDKNKSESLINALYRERSKLRQQIEESANAIKQNQDDLALLAPLLEKLEKEKKGIDSKMAEVEAAIEKAMKPLDAIQEENAPIYDEHEEMLAKLEESNRKLEDLKREADSLGGDLNALTQKREVAQANFSSKREEILETVRHPGHLYFGDETEVVVSSIAPSGKGIFIDQGRRAGLRDDMLFVSRKLPKPKEIPTILKSTIVEDEFAFLEFVKMGKSADGLDVQEGEKLFLIRTGDSNTTD